jgi:hypothetical protein
MEGSGIDCASAYATRKYDLFLGRKHFTNYTNIKEVRKLAEESTSNQYSELLNS